MSREDIVAIASRLFAVVLVLTGVRVGATAVGAMLSNHAGWDSLLYSLPVVLACIVPAFLLWYFPVTIARRLLPSMRDKGQPITAPGMDVQEIAFSILGAWVLAQSISDATYWVTLTQYMGTTEYREIVFTPSQKASIARNLTELVIGFTLLFGSRGLSSILHRLRYGSSPTQTQLTQTDSAR